MSRHPEFASSPDEVLAQRQQAGRWLRALREGAGYTQRSFAKAVGIDFYTFVSQIEAGRGKLPTHHFINWAEALNVPLKDFVTTLLQYYDPLVHYALFGVVLPTPIVQSVKSQNDNDATMVSDLAARIARLETLLAEQTSK